VIVGNCRVLIPFRRGGHHTYLRSDEVSTERPFLREDFGPSRVRGGKLADVASVDASKAWEGVFTLHPHLLLSDPSA
jgi:hypothetical protein